MTSVLIIVGAVVAVFTVLFVLAFAQLSALTFGWLVPLLVVANAVVLGWSAATGQVVPALITLGTTVFAFYGRFRREQRRSRILAHCVGALFSEAINSGRCTPEYLFSKIDDEITKDFWVEPLDKFARRDASLFDEPHLSNGGFVSWYRDLHRTVASEWFRVKQEAAARDASAA